MNISSDVHNYMETIVGQMLAASDFTEKYSEEQLADLACLALSQLRPVYIRYDIDFLSKLPEARAVNFKESAESALAAAESMIQNDRRQNRNEDDVPVIISTTRYKDDIELEWFEKPIVPRPHND
ncbi:late competence development ComFB family protein [Vibrio salinus]|uniref:late competence development ComFB family protein n=1 Tax=Vibrio salinus TaxID=2899784 RepID=UPI001E29BCAF|nr:late competence development ComFB family protein [Vibrio salinus]MCE0495818.1 late competence development ComFB family protein [Vibrio salinus]